MQYVDGCKTLQSQSLSLRANLVRLPNGTCGSFRIRANGDFLLACAKAVYRLSARGALRHTYDPGHDTGFSAVCLAPDGKTFWAQTATHVYHVSISTGAVLTSFANPATPITALFVYDSPGASWSGH